LNNSCEEVRSQIGPWGKEAHGRGESVYMPYSFETVPELLYKVILRALEDAVVQYENI
jgi:arginine utilization protein RocB